MNLPEYIKNRYLEMQAALNIMSENTLIGVGLGNFQNLIGTYYKELPKVNTAEPNQHNGYNHTRNVLQNNVYFCYKSTNTRRSWFNTVFITKID